MHKLLKFLIVIFSLTIFSLNGKAQTIESLSKMEVLLVNSWEPVSLVINEKDVPLTKTQKEGRFQFLSDHTSRQSYSDLTENGKWILNEKKRTISIIADVMQDEAVILKIVILTEKQFVFSIFNDDTNQKMVFSNIAAKEN